MADVKLKAKNWREISKRCADKIVRGLGDTVFSRLVQITDYIRGQESNRDANEVASEEMQAISGWTVDDWKVELSGLLKRLPSLETDMNSYIVSNYWLLHGQVPYEDEVDVGAITFSLAKNAYLAASNHFTAYPISISSTNQNDPAGVLYNKGKQRTREFVKQLLLTIVPTPKEQTRLMVRAPVVTPAPHPNPDKKVQEEEDEEDETGEKEILLRNRPRKPVAWM